MCKVCISELRKGCYLVKRMAHLSDQYLSRVATYIYSMGGVEIDQNHFRVVSPCLLPFVREIEKMLNIQFVEIIEKEG